MSTESDTIQYNALHQAFIEARQEITTLRAERDWLRKKLNRIRDIVEEEPESE